MSTSNSLEDFAPTTEPGLSDSHAASLDTTPLTVSELQIEGVQTESPEIAAYDIRPPVPENAACVQSGSCDAMPGTYLVERRKIMPLDAAYFYLRHLELKLQTPDLFKVCNSIHTIDLVIEDKLSWDRSMGKFSALAWSKIRDKLFNILVLNFSGRFVVYSDVSKEPLSFSEEWPSAGYVEFYPEKNSRPREFYKQSLERLEPAVLQTLKIRFSQSQSKVRPSHFPSEQPQPTREAISLLHRFYEICEEEAEKGRASAHNLWWHLDSEAKRCLDRRRRKELQKRMLRLQTIWGTPTHRS
jgi:hypothetical protein